MNYSDTTSCMICGKVLNKIEDFDNIDDGGICQMSFHYGSKHDGDVFQLGLCDNCVDYLLKKRKIQLLGNFLFPKTQEDFKLEDLKND